MFAPACVLEGDVPGELGDVDLVAVEVVDVDVVVVDSAAFLREEVGFLPLPPEAREVADCEGVEVKERARTAPPPTTSTATTMAVQAVTERPARCFARWRSCRHAC